jgi:hypothetical protein
MPLARTVAWKSIERYATSNPNALHYSASAKTSEDR